MTMAKQMSGWRDPKEWDIDGKDSMILTAINLAIRSDDGWYCPHCNYKDTLRGSEISNEDYFSVMEEYDPVEVDCGNCGGKYYIKCSLTRRYYSCADKEFEDG